MLTKKSAIKLVSNFIQEILDNGIPLNKAILFGSFASNSQKKDSDIDVALFSTAFSGIGFNDKKLIAKWNIKPEYIDIDIKTYSISDQDPFIEIIEKTGIPVYTDKPG